jgi:hypothetical protein
MFGFFKKDGIGSALDEVQEYHKRLGLDMELSSSIVAEIKNFDLFKDIDKRHKSKGLSKYGGLAWFCTQFIINTVKALDNGHTISAVSMDTLKKMMYVSLAIGNSIPELKLTKEDMNPIQASCESSMDWMKKNPDPLEAELSAFSPS